MAADPLPNWHRIDIPQCSGAGIINDLKAEEARTPGGVKTKHCVRRNTDPIMRHNAEHQRTGRRTSTINNDLLAGVTKRHKARPINADIAAPIVGYANRGGCGFREAAAQRQAERNYECNAASKHRSPRRSHGSISNIGVRSASEAPHCNLERLPRTTERRDHHHVISRVLWRQKSARSGTRREL